MKKRGVSPVITTVLLVLIVLILAVIIFLWARGFMKEQITKFDRPIEEKCGELRFTATLSGSSLAVSNTGDIPIYKIGIRKSGTGRADIDYTEVNLVSGRTETITIDTTGLDEISVIPVLLGKNEEDVVKEYSCSKDNWKIVPVQ